MPSSFLLYRSRTDLGPRSRGCADIISGSRLRNPGLDLTGYLHLEDGLFYQWLEGPKAAVDQMRGRIASDSRHRDMETLWSGEQSERKFGAWQMGFGLSDPGTLFSWVAQNGVSVSDPVEFANGVLRFMRAG